MADLLGQLLDLLARNIAFGHSFPTRGTGFGVGSGAILETIPISDHDADPIFSALPMDVAEAVLRVDGKAKTEDAASETPWLNANARPFYPLNVNAPEYVPLVPETDVSLAKLSASLGVPTSELSKATGGWWGNSMAGIRVTQWLSRSEAPRSGRAALADDLPDAVVPTEKENPEPVTLISAASLGSELGYLTHQYESHSSNWSGTLSCSDRSASPLGHPEMAPPKGQPTAYSPAAGFTNNAAPFATPNEEKKRGAVTSSLGATSSPPPSGVVDVTADQISQAAALGYAPAAHGTVMGEFLQAGVPVGSHCEMVNLLSSDLTAAIPGMEGCVYPMTEEAIHYGCVDATGQFPDPPMEDAFMEHEGQVAANEFYEDDLLFPSEAAAWANVVGGVPVVMPKLTPLSECLKGKNPSTFYPAKKAAKKSSFVQEFHAALAQQEQAHTATPKGNVEVVAATEKLIAPVSDGVPAEQPPPIEEQSLIVDETPCDEAAAADEPLPPATPEESNGIDLLVPPELQKTEEGANDLDAGSEEEIDDDMAADKENLETIDGNGETKKQETRKQQFLRLFKEAFQF